MSYTYKKDDLIFDIEIRNDFFVCVQYYPKKDNLIVSYLEKINFNDPVIKENIETKTNNLTNVPEGTNDLLNYLNQPTMTVEQKIHTTKTNSTFGQSVTSTYEKKNGHWQVKKDFSSHKYIAETIKKIATHYDWSKTKIYFENLADYSDFKNFVFRYGWSSSWQTGQETMDDPINPSYIVKETDKGFNADKYGIRIGYNNLSYDNTMLAYIIGICMPSDFYTTGSRNIFESKIYNFDNSPISEPLTPNYLTNVNSRMFSYNNLNQVLRENGYQNPGFATYYNYNISNRFIDVMKLNDTNDFLSLKRAAAYYGLKIKESETNEDPTVDLKTIENIADVISYCANDVWATKYLFELPYPYQSSLKTKRELIEKYPYTVYNQVKGAEKKFTCHEGDPLQVSSDRITINSTSNQAITKVIAPYENTKIIDNPCVDLHFPDKQMWDEMKENGTLSESFIEYSKSIGKDGPIHVLEYLGWEVEKLRQTLPKHVGDDLYEQFNKVKMFYSRIEGKNVNDSLGDTVSIASLMNPKTQVRYVTPQPIHDKFGREIVSYFTPSFGGLHGQEVVVDEYKKSLQQYQYELNRLTYMKTISNSDTEEKLIEYLKLNKRTKFKFQDQEFTGQNLLRTQKGKLSIKMPTKPSLTTKEGTFKAQYKYTSIARALHQDFSSYYPLLIYLLAIFRNSDGIDIYGEIYKIRVGLKQKASDKTLSKEKRAFYKAAQLVYKLLLNAGSGGADIGYPTNIKANNKIMSMRIIGQIFTWWIGQLLSLNGARIPSTNTDGLYAMNIDDDLNNEIVKNAAKSLCLDIEPEVIDVFISKDANNRMEVFDGKIREAKGGMLTSWSGASATKNSSHATIIDRVLATYLSTKEDSCDTPFDRNYARQIMYDFISSPDMSYAEKLRYVQWITVSNNKKGSIIFERDLNTQKITLLSRTNRVFLVKNGDKTIQSTRLRVVDNNTIQKRIKERGLTNYGELLARDIMETNDTESYNIIKTTLGNDWEKLLNVVYDKSVYYNKSKDMTLKIREPAMKKITDFPENHPIIIYNESLDSLNDEQAQKLLNIIDYESFLDIIEKYHKKWTNIGKVKN